MPRPVTERHSPILERSRSRWRPTLEVSGANTSAGCRGADLPKGMTMFDRLFLTLQLLRLKLTDEEGATAVEYGIMVALIAVAIIVVVGALGLALSDTFQDVVNVIPGTPGEL